MRDRADAVETKPRSDAEVREEVRARYADAALTAEPGCCDDACCGPADTDLTSTDLASRDLTSKDLASKDLAGTDLTGGLYRTEDIALVPAGAAAVSLGCGNPTAVADLQEGETVLDLGSGAGIDVLLSAQRVGPSGFAYGVDMTDEMLALARKHQKEAGASNVEFLKGHIEDVPLADSTVDVVISNCVINLAADKQEVFAEMFRVLRPGGRLGVSDIVAEDSLTPQQRAERGNWVGCIAGALSFSEYEQGLRDAGFVDITLTTTHQVAEGMASVIIKAGTPGANRVPVRARNRSGP